MYYYILQEKIDNDSWIDLYTNELYYLKKMWVILKRKNLGTKYRIVRVYR